jgi:hypothetical protein
MKKILRFNWPFYARTSGVVVAVWVIALFVPPAWRAQLLIGSLPALWWICTSLLVSHYIYDRSSLYSMSWLSHCMSRSPQRWVNIHAGLDEMSDRLAGLFPSARGCILDIHDPHEMTEPSIAEARRITHASIPATSADWRALPLADRTFDTAFLIFAAHELRRPEARAQLFREAARVLRGDGEMVVVEHLRDWANFLAFGPGFLHFLPERAWRQAATAAGLRIRRRVALTPFVKIFVLRRCA